MAVKAPAAPSHALAVADELGLVKIIHIPGNNWGDASVVQIWGKPDRANAVVRICCSVNSSKLATGESAVVACSRRGGTVDVVEGENGAHHSSIAASTSGQEGKHDVHGLTFLHAHQHTERCPKLLSATAAGCLRIHSCQAAAAAAVWQEEVAFQTIPNLLTLALDAQQQRVAVGGEGSQLQVWELATQQRTFQAKGAKPSSIGLVEPAFVTAAAWLPEGEAGAGVCQRLLAGTREHSILLYDMRVGRRVQTEVSWGGARITSLTAEQDGSKVWVANATGHMEAFDLRALRMMGALKGAGGSIRGMSLHPSEGLVASAGLDRYLRVHSTSSRKSVGKVYLKQGLTALCWLPVSEPPAAGEAVDNAPPAEAAAASTKSNDRDRETQDKQPKKKRRGDSRISGA